MSKGSSLGHLNEILQTGANDVYVVQMRLISVSCSCPPSNRSSCKIDVAERGLSACRVSLMGWSRNKAVARHETGSPDERSEMPSADDANQDRRFWLAFNLVRGIGAVRLRSLIDHFGSASAAWNAPPDELRDAGLGRQDDCPIARSAGGRRRGSTLAGGRRDRGIRVLTSDDPAYPGTPEGDRTAAAGPVRAGRVAR